MIYIKKIFIKETTDICIVIVGNSQKLYLLDFKPLLWRQSIH